MTPFCPDVSERPVLAYSLVTPFEVAPNYPRDVARLSAAQGVLSPN